MHKAGPFLFVCAVSFGFAPLLPHPAAAAWPSDPLVNVPVCNAARDQQMPVSVPDGAGGAIITWLDSRTWLGYYGENLSIYAQRVSADGTPMWTSGGVALCTASGLKGAPAIVSDGAGGAIVTWDDSRGFNSLTNCCDPDDIYVQRISAAGTPLWSVNGVAVCTAPKQQTCPAIASDGAGGAIITWQDTRDSSYVHVTFDIYAQRISAGGGLQWAADGVPLCAAPGDQQYPVIASDGASGAIISWADHRPGAYYDTYSDIYSQRVSAAGVPQWTADGVALCTAAYSQLQQTTVPDGAGGAIVTWQDGRSGIYANLYAQRVSADGAVQWPGDGMAVCLSGYSKWNPTMATDGAGGAVVSWWENRFGSYDIYAERILATGTRAWDPYGLIVCNYYDDQRYPTIASDGANGAIVTWQDLRSGVDYDIYAQRISAAGAIQWTYGGVALSTSAGQQSQPGITTDGANGAIVAWADERNMVATRTDIYAQRVQANGLLGGDLPAGVPADVPLAFALDPVRPNPTRGGALTVHFTLASGTAASLELLDVAGRRIAAHEVGLFGAGRHSLDLGEGRRLAPGLYLVRLRQGANTRVTRVAVLD
jgi:hypothetical protein